MTQPSARGTMDGLEVRRMKPLNVCAALSKRTAFRFAEMAALKDGWYADTLYPASRSKRPSDETLRVAREFVRRHVDSFPDDCTKVYIYPIPDGGLSIEFGDIGNSEQLDMLVDILDTNHGPRLSWQHAIHPGSCALPCMAHDGHWRSWEGPEADFNFDEWAHNIQLALAHTCGAQPMPAFYGNVG